MGIKLFATLSFCEYIWDLMQSKSETVDPLFFNVLNFFEVLYFSYICTVRYDIFY
jgi:hypothetical protein